MAVLSTDQVTRQWFDGVAERTAVYALKNVNTGDTADLVADFTVLKRAVMIGATVAGAISASVAGTIVTMPTGLTADAAFLMVFGCAR
jgi:hypothetical protein